MSTIEDTEQASECLDHLQTMLWEVGDHSQDDEISSLICMLQSPLFRQLLVLQDSIQELEQVHDTHGLQNYDYSFMPELRLETKAESGSQEEMIPSNNHRVNSMPSYQQAAAKVIDSVAHGREVETIKMFKPEKQSLGFSVVTHAEGGIFVQDIQPGGIADRHGNLRERDQILSIDGQPLDISHQEAIKILQRAGGLVELVVARGPIPHGETPADTQDLTTQPSADTTDMVLSTEWTQIEVIDLINDGTGLGFGIIGGRSTGVVVKTILPGGVADVDERLHSGDHILQIGEVNVRGMGSEQVAAVLRQSGSHVRLIVARPIHEPPAVPVQHAPIVPTAQLDEHLEQINSFIEKQDQMMLDGQANEKEQIALYKQQQLQKSIVEKVQVHNPPVFGEEPPPEYPEVQYYDVTLAKDAEHGLGITIAGYVGRDNTPGTDDLCGIFVNSITKGSAADKDGQIQVNDQIIEVDGQALQGLSNHDAVEILRKNGQVVKLKLARYQHGDKFDKLQQYLAQPQPHPLLPINGQPSFGNEVIDQTQQTPGLDTEDIAILEDLDGEILPDVEAGIKACWEPIVGEDFEIVVSQLSKFREGGGLGISLEGTVDVENGVEVRPHHYIRAILPQGPVGINGRLCSGDELLEVNGKRLLGLNHKEVVGILKELPQNVRLVCARKKLKPNEASEEETGFQTPPLNSGVSEFAPERLVKSKSDNAISTESNAQTTNLPGKKSRSLEMLANLAMWSSEPVMIELTKADRGLGFSILDYQDPVNPNDTVIVIKSLVPGGVAQMDGRLVPGDRLMFVNEVNLENATLDEAVQALKGAQKGLVRIGVAKPLPLSGPFQEDSLTESEIAVSVASPQMASPNDTRNHDYINIEEFAGTTGLPKLARNESTSSTSTADGATKLNISANLSKKDSFYESDENTKYVSPSKAKSPSKPAIKEKPALKEKPSLDKFRPVPQPRKQDSQISNVTSYENEEAIQNFRSQELAQQLAIDMVDQTIMDKGHFEHDDVKHEEYDFEAEIMAELSSNVRAENTGMGLTQVKHGQANSSPEIFDYENNSMGPLPSYEEATSGDAEFFNMDDLEGPPVPIRADSHQVVMATPQSTRDTALLCDKKSPQPSPRRTTPEKPKGEKSPRPKPPIPPKPISPYSSNSLSQEVQEEGPPPLPFTSPPPLQPLDDDTKSSTSNTSTTPVSVKENPLSRIGMVSPSSDVRSDQLDTSSSSDQFNQSDLKVVQTSPTSSPRTTSPGISPISSPSLMRSFSGPDALPPSLQKKITLKRSDNNLGITVEASDKGINGCIVKSLAKTGAIYKHGQIQVGDHIMSINNESMRRITNTQARVILRRASLMGTADITLTYVTAADADAHKEAVARRQQDSPSTPTMMPSPKSTLSPLHKPSSTSDGSAQSSPLSSPHKTSSPTRVSTSPAKTTPQASPRQKETVVVGSGNQTWGPPRLVELYREPGKTLGISIVGGRVDMYHVAEEHVISGIFIKHVLEDSPAGRNGTLKTGDRILQVDGKDLRNATHDQAVDTIRNASNPVKFVVQSLVDPACPKDLDTDIKSVHSYDEGLQKLQAVAASNSNSDKVVVEPVLTQALAPPVETLPPPEPEPEPEEEPEEEDEPEDEFGYSNQRIQRRYGELNGNLLLVDLKRGTSGLGISLAGNKDRNTMSVFVAGIQPQSAAALDGRIQVGDELLEVNGNVLYGRSHLNASAIIKGIDAKIIKFVLLRRDDNLDRMAVKPLKVSTPVSIKQVEKPAVQQSEPATLTPVQAEEKRVPSPTTPSTHDVIQSISLSKGPSGLGFAIVEELREGTQGIYVRSITYGGVADKDGQLSVGDQILEVQDKSLTNVHYDKAIEILRNSQGNVRLKVRKCSPDGSSYTPNNVQGQEKITFKSMPGESSTDGPASQLSPEGHPVDPLTCPIIPGQETQIFIEKGRTGLGLSIVGGADTLLGAIIIHEVYEDGAAARDGRLWAGDQVLEVNNENLREATHDYAIQVLRQTPATVQMLVFRDDAHVKEEDIYDIFTVELIKKPGKGLGLSIVGKRNDVGVYISDIVKGGAAESDARLMQGDQILAVNGEDMRNATQEYAAAVLKTTMGKVTLTVGRLKAGSRTSSRKNSNSHGTALKKSESTASNKSKGGRHSKKGSEDMSHIRTVELEHDTNGSLGLSIAGGIGSPLGDTPILVANLTPGGSAERSRKLKVGDKILSINGVNTDGMNHDQVIQILKSSRGSITLQVTQGEQTQVSVSGRTSSTKGLQPDVQTRNMPLENNVFDDGEDGPPPQCKTITLERGQDGLGFSIVGGHASPHGDLPIYVKNVFSKGAAADNGQLKRGDQILTVNGTSLEGLTHEEAVNILKNAKGSVIMSVLS